MRELPSGRLPSAEPGAITPLLHGVPVGKCVQLRAGSATGIPRHRCILRIVGASLGRIRDAEGQKIMISAIVIERVANGYLVRPDSEECESTDIHVFEWCDLREECVGRSNQCNCVEQLFAHIRRKLVDTS